MVRVYLDTCLIVGYFHPNEPQRQHQRARDFFNRVNDIENIEFCCSHFTITEFTWAYITKPNISDSQAHQIANSLLLTNKIDRRYPFTLLRTYEREEYTFEDFFLDVQTILLNTTPRPGIADAVHATIMKNNGITEIVTFNVDDFRHIEKITASIPEDIN